MNNMIFNQKKISVYPNPTSDILYISNQANEMLEMTILSSLGKPVKQFGQTRALLQ